MEILKRLAFFMLAENAQVPTSGLSAARQKIRSGAEVTIGRTFTLAFRLEWFHHGPDGTDMTGKTLDVSSDAAK